MENILRPEILFPAIPKEEKINESLFNILYFFLSFFLLLLLFFAIIDSSFTDYAIDALSIIWFFTKIPTIILTFTWLLTLTIWIIYVFRKYAWDYAVWGKNSILKGDIMGWYDFLNIGILYIPGKDPWSIIVGIICIIFSIFVILFLIVVICILYTPLIILLSIMISLNPFESKKIHEDIPMNPLKLIIPFIMMLIMWGGSFYFRDRLFKGLNLLNSKDKEEKKEKKKKKKKKKKKN